MQPGETWAYRKKRNDPLQPARIVRHGTSRPKWALVRFTDPESEGLQDWVPRSRLQCLWEERAAFMEREARWQTAAEASADVSEACAQAVGTVLDACDVSGRVDYSTHERQGISVIAEPLLFVKEHGLDHDELRKQPAVFTESGNLIVPWPVMEGIARVLAPKHQSKVLEAVQYLEDAADHQLMLNLQRFWDFTGPKPFPNDDARDYALAAKESRELVRRWCGVEALDQWREIQKLRKEVARLGCLINTAAALLEKHGRNSDAGRVRKAHGVSAEYLGTPLSFPELKKLPN